MHLRQISIHTDRYPADERYPFNLRVLRETPGLDLEAPVVFFVGENGSGKSTLLKAIAMRSNIHIWKGESRIRYQSSPFEELLYRFISVNWSNGSVPGSYFASEIFRSFAQILDEWAASDPGVLKYFGERSLMSQSHGQSHMAFFDNRFRLEGLYLLDEPENALSPRTQLQLLKLLQEASGSKKAQFLIATHSPILMACPDAIIYSFDHSPIKRITYEETDHYRVYRDFLNHRERYLSPSGGGGTL